MSTGFHPSRTVGQATTLPVSSMFLARNDYSSRCRPTVVEFDLRGTSRTSEFFERIYERDRRSQLPESADADPVMEALDLLLVLQPGWDGRRAPAPTREAITLGRQAVALADRSGLMDARVTPDVEGGVAVYFFGGGRHSDGGWNRQGAIMVSNDGEASLYLRDRSMPGADVADISTDAEGLGKATEQIRKFILGS